MNYLTFPEGVVYTISYAMLCEACCVIMQADGLLSFLVFTWEWVRLHLQSDEEMITSQSIHVLQVNVGDSAPLCAGASGSASGTLSSHAWRSHLYRVAATNQDGSKTSVPLRQQLKKCHFRKLDLKIYKSNSGKFQTDCIFSPYFKINFG